MGDQRMRRVQRVRRANARIYLLLALQHLVKSPVQVGMVLLIVDEFIMISVQNSTAFQRFMDSGVHWFIGPFRSENWRAGTKGRWSGLAAVDISLDSLDKFFEVELAVFRDAVRSVVELFF